MEKAAVSLFWLFLYGYCIERPGTVQKGLGRRVSAALTGLFLLLQALWMPLWAVWLLEGTLAILYVLFFDEEPFRLRWPGTLLPALLFAGLSAAEAGDFLPVGNGIVCFVLFLLLVRRRNCLRVKNAAAVGLVYALLSAFLYLLCASGTALDSPGPEAAGLSGETWPEAAGLLWETGLESLTPQMRRALLWGAVLAEAALFFALEGTLFSWQKGFENSTERFQEEVLAHQYEEIRTVYTNMRGWRHDYHNHLQVIKAQLALGKTDELERYLDELEQDLDRVDFRIRSGNLMADAILNSKLSLARQEQIAISCRAKLPADLPVEDVDLCVILGNLLDNALEACGQIPQSARFLRVYLAVNGRQFYMSVQNSAKEELNFDERNYITRKRGNHGLGMKRVSAVVEKYEGFLNLANEPGVFAAEVTLPLSGWGRGRGTGVCVS